MEECEEAEEDGGAGKDGEDGGGESGSMPSNTKELLLAIANEDFGVSADHSSTLASPAMKAYNKLAADGEKVKHVTNTDLPPGFVIVKVMPFPLSRLTQLRVYSLSIHLTTQLRVYRLSIHLPW